MASFDDFYPLILPECLGAPAPSVDSALIRAARELCERGHVWKISIDDFPLEEGVPEYDLGLDAGAMLCTVESIKADGVPIGPLATTAGLIDDTGGASSPTRYLLPDDLTTITFRPTPTLTGTIITGAMWVKPKISATTLADVLYDRWAEVLAAGARAILKRMPGKAWSDPKGAAEDRDMFESGIAGALVKSATGNTYGSLTARRVPFGGFR